MLNKYFEEYRVGDSWISKGRTITETDLVMFSAFSGDWYPLHSDIEYARQTQFKERIAHGMLILSVSTGLMQFEPGIVIAFYGMDKVRFIAPNYIGDTIHLNSKVTDLQETGVSQGIVTISHEVRKQSDEVTAVFDMKVLVTKGHE
ncbi:MAG: MaoC/PaaZ C-terminal domain-containing protein [Bacillus sp. (in: firmicutes)]